MKYLSMTSIRRNHVMVLVALLSLCLCWTGVAHADGVTRDNGEAITGADRDAVFGHTPLQRAVTWSGYTSDTAEVVELLDSGTVDVNEPDGEGKTALMYAIIQNQVTVCRLLLNAGADVQGQTTSGTTALMWAVDKGKPKIVEMLIDAGANVNAVDVRGNTALDRAYSGSKKSVIPYLERAGAQRGREFRGYGE